VVQAGTHDRACASICQPPKNRDCHYLGFFDEIVSRFFSVPNFSSRARNRGQLTKLGGKFPLQPLPRSVNRFLKDGPLIFIQQPVRQCNIEIMGKARQSGLEPVYGSDTRGPAPLPIMAMLPGDIAVVKPIPHQRVARAHFRPSDSVNRSRTKRYFGSCASKENSRRYNSMAARPRRDLKVRSEENRSN